MTPLHRFLALAAPLLAVLTIGAAPAAARPVVAVQATPIFTGASPDYYRAQLDKVKGTHASVVRTEVSWSELEPDAAARQDPDYVAGMDAFFKLAAERGLKVVVTLQSSPCWASTSPQRGNCSAAQKVSEDVTSWPPSNPGDYAEAAAFVAKRYGSRLYGLEVWNEPDHENQIYFAGPDKPKRYAAILKASYKPIKRASPHTLVLGGALVGANGDFLKALYKQGIKGSYDALSVHYYDLVLASARSIRQVQARYGDKKPLWIGEFGWTNCYPRQKTQEGHSCVTSRVQALSIRDIFAAIRHTKFVKGAVVYNLLDTDQYDFGLIDQQGKLKSAYSTLAKVARRAPAPRPIRLSVKRRRGSLVASGSGPAGDAYELDVFKRGQLRYKLTFRLDRNLRYRFTLPRALGSRGLKVQVYQYWLGSKHGKRRSV